MSKLTPEEVKQLQEKINNTLWDACDTFRGVVDPSDYKNYILVFLFIKYLSDVYKDKYEELKKEYGDNEDRINRKLARERFVMHKKNTFDYILSLKNASKKKKEEDEEQEDQKVGEEQPKKSLGEEINKVLERLEENNKAQLDGVFMGIDFNSPRLGNEKDKLRRLQNLITDFSKPILDFRPSRVGSEDIIGNAYMYLIAKFASTAGKKGGEFYTPTEVSKLLAKLLQPQEGDRICDPACGSGSLLIKIVEEIGSKDFAVYGQESNKNTWGLCMMNMFLHGLDVTEKNIKNSDTINDPQLLEGDHLMKFDIVAANPPFSLDKWGADNAADDYHKRFWRGVPPKSKGDFAFITHMIETAQPDTGKIGVIVPHGVLFRGSSEGKIRRHLIEKDNLLEAVIGLPSNLFYGTGIPAAILIFDKSRKAQNKQTVLFVDASQEGNYEEGKKQNRLRDADIQRVVEAFKAYQTVEKYAYVATLDEIAENDYNLNIPRYVDTFEEEEPIDIVQTQQEILTLEKELQTVRKQMNHYLKELGFNQ